MPPGEPVVWCEKGDHPHRPDLTGRCLSCHAEWMRKYRLRNGVKPRYPKPPPPTREQIAAEMVAALDEHERWLG